MILLISNLSNAAFWQGLDNNKSFSRPLLWCMNYPLTSQGQSAALGQRNKAKQWAVDVQDRENARRRRRRRGGHGTFHNMTRAPIVKSVQMCHLRRSRWQKRPTHSWCLALRRNQTTKTEKKRKNERKKRPRHPIVLLAEWACSAWHSAFACGIFGLLECSASREHISCRADHSEKHGRARSPAAAQHHMTLHDTPPSPNASLPYFYFFLAGLICAFVRTMYAVAKNLLGGSGGGFQIARFYEICLITQQNQHCRLLCNNNLEIRLPPWQTHNWRMRSRFSCWIISNL